MSSKELIESLRRSGEESLRAIRREAEQEAEALKTAASQELSQLRVRHEEELSVYRAAQLRQALSAAESSGRKARLDAEKKLSDTLFSIARFSLHRFRNERPVEVFAGLAGELPKLPWQVVSVNARDVELARRHFPEARIEAVGRIAGGLETSFADDSIRIINTFEKRLERIWPALLPQMIRELEQELADESSSPTR